MSDFINTIAVLGDYAVIDSIITRSITEFKDDAVIKVGEFVFANCTELETVNLPAVTSILGSAFGNCTALAYARFSSLVSIVNNAFGSSGLTALILDNQDIVCTLSSNGLNNTPIASGTGYIYVPRALVDQYKSATNWSTVADQFRALEDYTVDGTTTGELDESKI